MKKPEDRDSIILTLSASKVKTYHQCPRKYYYNYVEKLPRKQWDHFDIGTLAHGALDYFHKSYRKDSKRKRNLARLMKKSFKKQRDQMEKKGSLDPEVLLTTRDILVQYLNAIEEKGIGSEILELEKDFTLPLNEKYEIRGIIDRLDRDADGVYHIKDYKTSKNPKYMDPEQLRIYGIYLLDKFPEVDRFRGSYIMLRFGNMHISYDFSKEDVEKQKRELLEAAEAITEEERWITKPTILCDWCDFKGPCFNSW